MAFKHYLEEEDDKPYFTTNSLGYYYDKMEGFAEKVEQAAKILNVTKEEVEKNITAYIEQNKNELDQRLAQWDGKLGTFDSSVETLLTEWVDDGTLTHVIDSTLIDQRIAPVTAKLAEKVGGTTKATMNDLGQDVKEALTGGSVAVVGVGAVGNVNIQPQAVTADKTTFLPYIANGKNKFNPNAAGVVANTVLGENGAMVVNTAYNTSDFIKVSGGDKLTASKTDISTITVRAYGFYDTNKTWISGDVTTEWEKNPMTAPADGYLRVSYGNVTYTGYQIELGIEKTSYEPYKEVRELDKNVLVNFESMNHDSGIFEKKAASRNLFNPNATGIIQKYRLSVTGELVSLASYNISDYISVKAGDKVYVSKLTNTAPVLRGYGFYTTEKVWISGSEEVIYNPAPALTAPADGFFRAVYNPTDFTEYQIEIGKGFTAYQPFEEKFFYDSTLGVQPQTVVGNTGFELGDFLSKWYGKKLITNGDSITYGTTAATGDYTNQKPWSKFVSEALGMALDNFAIGGCTIAVKETSPTERNPIVTRFSSMSDGDLIIIAGGSNDWQYDWTPLGDMSSRTNFTFYGALHNLCLGLIEKYTGKQLMFMTPIKRGQLSQETMNVNGKTLKQYGDIIKEVCGYYGIPVLDMYNECIINPHIAAEATRYIPDLVHPNRAGHEIMSRRVIGKVEALA